MSSADRKSRLGPGALKAAQEAIGGAGGLPSPPPRPGASVAATSAAQSAAEDLAAAAPPGVPTFPPVKSLSDEQAKARVARAAERARKRDQYPVGGTVTTPTGTATTRFVYEHNVKGQRVHFVGTSNDDFPDSGNEPTTYRELAANVSPSALGAAFGFTAPRPQGSETTKALRAATTLRGLADVSEPQRNEGGKHARAAARTVYKEILSAHEVYATDTPAFPQAKPRGLEYHRNIFAGTATVTPGFRTVVENFSESSEDEEIAALSPSDVIQRYRRNIETKTDRKKREREEKNAASPGKPRGRRVATDETRETHAVPTRKRSLSSAKDTDEKRDAQGPPTRTYYPRSAKDPGRKKGEDDSDHGNTKRGRK
jgi:hypothetical protein